MPFHNPYNFIPALPRRDMPEGLRDDRPAGHHRWHDQLWSGEITMTMTAVTPLLLMREREEVERHRHLEVATCPGPNGKQVVDLAPTQIKGMLRTIYEAVTDSRFGVFQHDTPLGYRSEVEAAATLKPAVVRPDSRVMLLGELRADGRSGSAAVILPAWMNHGNHRPSSLPDGFAHAQEADAVVEHSPDARGWKVVSLHVRGTAPEPGAGRHAVRGRLHITGPTIKGKLAERLFVTEVLSDGMEQKPSTTLSAEKSKTLIAGLCDLVAHQRAIHQHAGSDDVWADKKPWEYQGSDPGRTAWSRHLYDTPGSPDVPEWVGPDLVIPPPPGRLFTCWAEPSNRLRPVMVSRLLHHASPAELLDETLHPAANIDELSPADRLFGWTWNKSQPAPDRPEPSAHRGQVRVVRVETPTADSAVEPLAPLTIPPLATPKPSQGRFYLAPDDPTARPKRGALFDTRSQRLRGRKIFPHHQGLENLGLDELRAAFDYVPPIDHETKQERAKQDSQNATLHGWVRPKATFRFVLQVTDVHPMELGALLWLLDPRHCGTEGHPARHRIGMGKPLGFGSVELRMDDDATWFCTGAQMRDRLLMLEARPDSADPDGLAEQFENAMTPGFATVLSGVRTALAGFPARADVSYPRMKRPRSPGYEWFVQNEKSEGSKHWLPAIGTALTEYEADRQGLT